MVMSRADSRAVLDAEAEQSALHLDAKPIMVLSLQTGFSGILPHLHPTSRNNGVQITPDH